MNGTSPIRDRLPLWPVAAVLAVLLSWSGVAGAESTDTLVVHVLDVGQDDAMILHQPGACTAVIDAGGLLHGHRVTEKLQESGVADIDLVLISHPHLDHFGGLFDLAPRLTIKNLYDNGGSNPVPEYFDDYLALHRQLHASALRRGDRLACGDVEVSVLYPEKAPQPGDDINGSSLVLLVSFRNFRLLHMGDLAGAGEAAFLALDDDIKANLLKIAHHGAADATSSLLLQRAAPDYAVISSAADNRIDAPADEVLNRLTAAGITYFRTDRDGSVSFLVSSLGATLTDRHAQ